MTLELSNLENVDLEELSNVHFPKSRDVFLSAYLNLEGADCEDFLKKRSGQMRASLKGKRELLENLDACLKVVQDGIKKGRHSGSKTYVAFVSKSAEYYSEFTIPVGLSNLLVLDTSPYIRPLARARDEYMDYALAILDSENFRMYSVASTRVVSKQSKSTDLIGKHKKGGWSQMRFSRLRKEGVARFHKECVEQLKNMVNDDVEGIVLAGPGNAKDMFFKLLPRELQDKVVASLDVDMGIPLNQLLKEAGEELGDFEREESENAVLLLSEAIFKGDGVAYGAEETRDALVQGRASLLVMDSDKKLTGWLCEKCQIVNAGSPKPCPGCGGNVSTVDVFEELLEFALRMGTDVEFVKDNKQLEGLGGVAAFLRY